MSKIAVLLFKSTSKQKASVATLVPNMPAKKVGGLLEMLNSRTRRLVAKTKLPLFEVEILGHQSFGKQTFAAYQGLFDLGYTSVIGIANDCPNLNEKDILFAAESLACEKSVIGPVKDGGLYLLGLSKSDLTQEQFTVLNWQTATLTQEVQLVLKNKSTIVLSIKKDLDSVADFIAAFHTPLFQLNDFFSQLFSYSFQKIRSVVLIVFRFFVLNFDLRGPPIFIK